MTKHEAGKPAKEVLLGVAEVLTAMTFPVSMHWAKNSFEYIRPVHTLTVLLDDEALDLDFLDIHSGRVSRGHRFLGKRRPSPVQTLMRMICAASLLSLMLKSVKR